MFSTTDLTAIIQKSRGKKKYSESNFSILKKTIKKTNKQTAN